MIYQKKKILHIAAHTSVLSVKPSSKPRNPRDLLPLLKVRLRRLPGRCEEGVEDDVEVVSGAEVLSEVVVAWDVDEVKGLYIQPPS